MKKNYIAHLQQYDAKTSIHMKQDKYLRKFVKTCYQQADKENINPNVSNSKKQSSYDTKAKNKMRQDSGQSHVDRNDKHQTNSKSSKRVPTSPIIQKNCEKKSPIMPKQINISPYKCEVNSLHNYDSLYVVNGAERKIICCDQCSSHFLNRTVFFQKQLQPQISHIDPILNSRLAQLNQMKVECMKWQRQICEKQLQQNQKCLNYYHMLIAQLVAQQTSAISFINKYFQKCKERFNEASEAINNEIKRLQLMNTYEQRQQQLLITDREMQFIPVSLRQVEIELICIVIDSQIQQKICQRLEQFNLLKLNDFMKNSHQRTTKINSPECCCCNHGKMGKENLQKTVKRFDIHEDSNDLLCSQQVLENNNTKKIQGDLDISFEQDSQFVYGGDLPIIAGDGDQEEMGISPSFKHF